VIHADETMEIIGRGAATVVDGSQIVTDAFQTKGYRPMMVSGAILHSLPSGYRFDLRSRVLLPTAVEGPVKREEIPHEPPSRRLRRLSREVAVEGADSIAHERRRAREEREAS